MTRFNSALFAAVAIAAMAALARPAAAIEYPWCAQYGGDDGGGRNCGFTTLEHCRATVSGMADSANPTCSIPAPLSSPSNERANVATIDAD